jgi:hypothetical protein
MRELLRNTGRKILAVASRIFPTPQASRDRFEREVVRVEARFAALKADRIRAAHDALRKRRERD